MIAFLLDILYFLILVLALPWLVFKAMRTGKYRAGLAEKFFGTGPARDTGRPCVWFHAVSVGEVLLLRRVVAELMRRRPDVEIVISTTTNTGMEVARQQFGQHRLLYFPLDFSWAVSRAIARIRPDVVALAELELWPNFIAAAKRFGARIAVINGRMSPRSHRGYGRIRLLMRHLLAKIDTLAVQTDEYAQRFVEIGAPRANVVVTGSVKYDGVETDRNNSATAKLREGFGIRSHEIVWVAGSTSEPEEQIVLDAYEQLCGACPNMRLIIVPRHKERFDQVARLIELRGFAITRRSELQQAVGRTAPGTPVLSTPYSAPSTQPFLIGDQQSAIRNPQSPITNSQSKIKNQKSKIILVDTLGELSAVWGLADIAFVGGSFAPRGGQNMIEPAGYGAALTFGPGVWNFQDTVDHLLARGGAVQVATAEALCRTVGELAADEVQRRRLGHAARAFVQSQHGATARTIEILNELLPESSPHLSEAA